MSALVVPSRVLEAYGWQGLACRAATSGLINDTFFVLDGGAPLAVVQRLHPVFGAAVNEDIDAVTAHLAAHQLVTPRLLRTTSGARWVEHEGVWRAISYVAGRTFDELPSTDAAYSAGELVGRVHRALSDFTRPFVHVRGGVHDTAAHVAKLAHVRATQPHPELDPLADQILEAASTLYDFSELPQRPCHGDLKISNVLFAERTLDAVCLIDLDTFALQQIAYELGDALRSWCNPHAEDAAEPELSVEIVSAAMRGYASSAHGLLTSAEQRSIAAGLVAVPIELAARFCADAYEDHYFGWDATRYASRREHNVARAASQLKLGRLARQSQREIDAIVSAAFAA